MKISTEIKIDATHLDALGHVGFLEHQRIVHGAHILMTEGGDLGIAALQVRGLALVMRQVRVDYCGQLFLDEVVTVEIQGCRDGARFVFDASLSRDGQPVSRLAYTMALCGIPDGQPKRPPDWIADKFPVREKYTPATVLTPAIGQVDIRSRNVLPTGALKFEDGTLYQEAHGIVHRADAGEPVGFYSNVWFPVSGHLVAAIRDS